MKRSPWIYVVFFYEKGKLVAAHTVETYSIAMDNIVKSCAIKNGIEYNYYVPAFIHA